MRKRRFLLFYFFILGGLRGVFGASGVVPGALVLTAGCVSSRSTGRRSRELRRRGLKPIHGVFRHFFASPTVPLRNCVWSSSFFDLSWFGARDSVFPRKSCPKKGKKESEEGDFEKGFLRKREKGEERRRHLSRNSRFLTILKPENKGDLQGTSPGSGSRSGHASFLPPTPREPYRN